MHRTVKLLLIKFICQKGKFRKCLNCGTTKADFSCHQTRKQLLERFSGDLNIVSNFEVAKDYFSRDVSKLRCNDVFAKVWVIMTWSTTKWLWIIILEAFHITREWDHFWYWLLFSHNRSDEINWKLFLFDKIIFPIIWVQSVVLKKSKNYQDWQNNVMQ